MDAKQSSRFRALLFPWLAHGHVFPFLELAKVLSKRNFDIYLCSTAVILESIKTHLKPNSDFAIELVEFRLPSHPELPPQYHSTKTAPPHLQSTLFQLFDESKSSFCDSLSDLKPDLLIYDGFQPWSAKFAASQGIPAVHFSIAGAAAMLFLIHGLKHKSYDTFPYPSLSPREYEQRSMIAVSDTLDDNFFLGTFKQSCDILLVKSCVGVEGKYMDSLSRLCERRIVPTGPLLTNAEMDEDVEIIEWLSKKAECSTLYIAFGSENYLSREQIQEIAKGLLLSDVNFIWVARAPIGSDIVVEDSVPDGFLERVKERGIILQKWASQAAILAHPSIGGFLSHCGWSSVSESIYFGVPIVAVPLKFDQPVNCRLAVDVGVGVEVMRDGNGEFNGQGVAKAINLVIAEEGLRSKARELSKKMRMEENEALDHVAEELSRVCANNLVAET